MRYTDDRFRSEHDATIGVEFGSKTIVVGENTTIKIQVWDTVNSLFIWENNFFTNILRFILKFIFK